LAAAEAELKSPVFDPNWKPQASFDEVFVVPHPRESVWEFFGRVDEVAACLPGAAVVGTPSDQRVEGQIRVKVGPILADFHGVAALERDHASYEGRIRGSGSDASTNSMTRGEVRYRLLATEDAAATRVEVTIGYSLTGLLAQVGRSGLVREVAGRLTATFAQNVSKRLSGATETGGLSSAAELNAGSLVFSVLMAHVNTLFRRLIGRG
jgi:carbon-monoxide dehydrogenase small subunit